MSNALANYISTIPAVSGANPGRPGWTIRSGITALADAGASGLAGMILAHGYDASRPVKTCANTEHVSMSEVCSELLAALESRKTEKGQTKSLTLTSDAEGKPFAVSVDTVRTLLSECEPQNIVPSEIIPHHGGGNNRALATILAAIVAAAAKRDPSALGPVVFVDVGTTDKTGAGALTDNMLDDMRRALTTWQKVVAAVPVLKAQPALMGKNGESRLAAIVGCKRGVAQLMHAGGVSIIKHGLMPDTAARCPSADEWRSIKEATTSEEARTMLDKVQRETRPKAVGVNVWCEWLLALPEDYRHHTRIMGAAMKEGTEAAFNSYAKSVMAEVDAKV